MTVLRKDVEWMQDVPFSCLQETLRSLQTAFKNFFDRVKKGQRVSEGRNPFGYPVYRNRYRLLIPFKPANLTIKRFSDRAGGDEGLYFSELKVPLIDGLIKFRQTLFKTTTFELKGNSDPIKGPSLSSQKNLQKLMLSVHYWTPIWTPKSLKDSKHLRIRGFDSRHLHQLIFFIQSFQLVLE